MKGKYNGCHMTTYGYILPGSASIAHWAARTGNLSQRAKLRLKVVDWHRMHGKNVSLISRHFGFSRITIRDWAKRFDKNGLPSLNDKSKRPHKLRQPITPWNTVMRTVQLRKQYPTWSKYKIKVLLEREGIQTSASTVGRIFKRKDLINKKISIKRRRSALHPKARFPKGLRISEPGDMVQIDTKYIMLPGGKKYYQFTAIDVLGKARVLRAYSSQSSRNAAHYLMECILNFPFIIKRIQTDNGSPFLKEFEKMCKEKNIPHYFTYPRSPKQNTYVEISHGADEREFYQQGNAHSILSVMQEKLREREHIWNNVRPHEALGYLTPAEYLVKLRNSRIPTRDIITLQT